MDHIVALSRLTDASFRELVEKDGRPFLLLFESRYDANASPMLEHLQWLLFTYETEICGGVCMVEDTPDLTKRFSIYGVPTLILRNGDEVLGEVLGPRSREELTALVRTWLGRNGDEPSQ